jgi:hypothetical protein
VNLQPRKGRICQLILPRIHRAAEKKLFLKGERDAGADLQAFSALGLWEKRFSPFDSIINGRRRRKHFLALVHLGVKSICQASIPFEGET